MDCLKEIIGIAATNCGCLTDNLPPEVIDKLSPSTSGYYLEDLEGLPQLRSAMSLDACKSMAQLALDARDEAIKRTADDLMISLNSLYTKAKKAFIGNLGQLSFAGSIAANQPLQGMKLTAVSASDAIITVNRIQLIISSIENTAIQVVKAYKGAASGVVINTLPVTSNAGQYTPVPLPDNKPLILPLSENGQPLEYFFVYERGAALPKDNKTACLPCQKNSGNILGSFINVVGVQLANLNELSSTNGDVYARGIILDVDIRCTNQQFICKEYSRDEVIAIALAFTVRYKTGELMIEKIMASGEINRYTTMNREFLWGKRNAYKKEYADRIKWLASAVDTSTSDCFTCNKKTNAFYTGILS